ncbi:MAG: beta-lactamase family protein [Erysipelotrichaceae bacterium]|nr:beta-lactamase family protein [Erysipelotrichaceae bacterium]
MNKEELHSLIEQNQPNICQVVAYRDNRKVYSDCWNSYREDDCVHIMSATKSVMALLVGIAVDREEIKSIDDKVLSYFPDYQIKRGEKTIQEVTIRHLLTMRAPYKCRHDPWTKVCISENWTYSSLDFLGGRKGLTDEFNYQTVCLHVLSGLLYQATCMITVDYANRYLFEPLGIKKHENYIAKSAEEHKQFTIEKTPKKDVWFADPQDLGTPGYGLCMSAQDMARIGLVCLNEGSYNDHQIVSANWIREMTEPRTVESPYFRGMDYGYLWWIIDHKKDIYAAIGNSGNVIYVNPYRNIVVAVASYFKPTIFDRVDFIQQHIEPFVMTLAEGENR